MLTVILTIATWWLLLGVACAALVLVMAGMAWLVRRVQALRCVPRRGLAPQAWVRAADGTPQPFRPQDYGDGDDVVPEAGFDPRQLHVLFCMRCGRGAHVPSFATNVGGCPDCGGQRWSNRPDLPILGEPKERAR